jgi:hypothetical protein
MNQKRDLNDSNLNIKLLSEDPLSGLYQIEEGVDLKNKEASVLLTRLLENVEEFYELRERIKQIIVEDHLTEKKVLNLFETLIQGIKTEKNSLEKDKFSTSKSYIQ